MALGLCGHILWELTTVGHVTLDQATAAQHRPETVGTPAGGSLVSCLSPQGPTVVLNFRLFRLDTFHFTYLFSFFLAFSDRLSVLTHHSPCPSFAFSALSPTLSVRHWSWSLSLGPQLDVPLSRSAPSGQCAWPFPTPLCSAGVYPDFRAFAKTFTLPSRLLTVLCAYLGASQCPPAPELLTGRLMPHPRGTSVYGTQDLHAHRPQGCPQ